MAWCFSFLQYDSRKELAQMQETRPAKGRGTNGASHGVENGGRYVIITATLQFQISPSVLRLETAGFHLGHMLCLHAGKVWFF